MPFSLYLFVVASYFNKFLIKYGRPSNNIYIIHLWFLSYLLHDEKHSKYSKNLHTNFVVIKKTIANNWQSSTLFQFCVARTNNQNKANGINRKCNIRVEINKNCMNRLYKRKYWDI